MQIGQIESVTLPLQAPQVEREPGVHVSQIVNDLYFTLFPRKDDGELSVEDELRIQMGFLWEEALTHVWGARSPWRPPQVCVDGIWGSADGLDTERGVIHEYKCTWTSAKRTPADVWRWMAQVKAYCGMYGVDQAQFDVLHVCGDYGRPIRPQHNAYLVTFSEQEIVENWKMLLGHAQRKGWQ